MRKNAVVSCLIACSLGVISAGVITACGGDDDDDSSAGAGGIGNNGGSGGSTGGPSSDGVRGEINSDCPPDREPHDGKYAQRDECCRRSSNIARIDPSASERVYEFRTNEFLLINHRATVNPSITALGRSTIDRFNAEQQSILFRFTLPQKDGKIAAGKGKLQIGAGRYNCDGTYSYYSETAAKGGNGNADRWFVPTIEAEVKPDEKDQDLIKPTFKNALPVKNRLAYLPYLSASDYTLEWEGASQGFDIIEMPTDEASTDCVGSYSSNSSGNPWRAAGKTISYGRLDANNTNKKIVQLGINFCQLLAFGPTPETATKQPNCETEPRCTPGEGCIWQRLPDSLCPTDPKAGWGCHLGTDSNPDNDAVKLNCTKDAPAESSETPTSDGQCCDPLGKSKDIPACNAWLQINEFVAGAVEITDKPADDIQQKCN